MNGSASSTDIARNVPWTLLSYLTNRGITLAVTVVLAHLITPADFGLVTLALTIMTVFNIVSGLGISNVLVTERDLDERAAGTLLTLTAASGAVVAILVVALAPVTAALFNQRRLEGVLAAVAAIVFITSFTWFYDALLQRELRFRRRLLALSVQNVVYAGLAVALALGGAGYWSLVGGQLGGAIAAAVAFALLAPARPRPCFHPLIARRALSSGSGFLLQGAFGFVQQNADFIVVGRMLGATPLGLYSAAYRMGDLPYSGIADPVSRVTFPAFARMHQAGQAVGDTFLKGTRIVLFVSAPIGILMSATASPFIETVLGRRWLPMTGALTVFGIWAAIRSIEGSMAWFLNAIGQARIVGSVSAALVVPLLGGIVLAALIGITAVAVVVLAHTCALVVALAIAIQRHAGVKGRVQLLAARGVVLGSTAAWLAAAVVARTTSLHLPPHDRLLLAALAGLLAYLSIIALFDRQLIWDFARQLERVRRRPTHEPFIGDTDLDTQPDPAYAPRVS